MRGKYQKILFKLLAVLTASLVVFSHLVFPSYAQDSVSSGLRSCAADPVCRLSLVQNARDLGVAPKVVPISQNIGLKLLQGGAQVSSNTVAISPASAGGSTNIAKIVISGIPIIGGALAAFFFGVSQIENLQKQAAEAYCTANPLSPVCGSTAFLVRNPRNEPSYRNGGRQSIAPPLIHTPKNNNTAWDVTDSLGRILDSINSTEYGFFQDTYEDLLPSVPWEQWPAYERGQAINMVPDSVFKDLIESLPPRNLISSIPSDTDTLELTGGELRLVRNPDGSYRLVPIGNPAIFPTGDPDGDLDGDGIPNKSDPDIDGDNVPNTSDPEPYNSSVPNSDPNPNPSPSSSPSPNPSPSSSPSSPPEPIGEVPSQPGAATFSKPNFVTHAFTVFKTKFPLDIMGTLPPGQGLNECPKVTFWREDFEVCLVRDFLKMLKIPIVIAFIIWALLTL